MMQDVSSTPLSASVKAEAAAWVARLHSSGRTPAAERALRQWLKSDPAHRQAFELATEAWEIGGSVPGGALPRVEDVFDGQSDRDVRQARVGPVAVRSILKSPKSRGWLAAAAALGVVSVGALLYLSQGQAVSTAVGEQRMVTLNDGSRIFLNTDTRLFVEETEAVRQVRLESGEALFDVIKDASRPFVVTAGDRSVVALGTSFVVRRDARALSVTLVEGKVAVSAGGSRREELPGTRNSVGGSVGAAGSAGESTGARSSTGPAAGGSSSNAGEAAGSSAISEIASNPGAAGETVLLPGQRLTFVAQAPPRLDEPSIERVTAWRRGEVILDKTSLADAAAEMNRYSEVKLVIDDAAAGEIAVSGIFRAGDSARFARAVSETYGLSVDYGERRIVLARTPSSLP